MGQEGQLNPGRSPGLLRGGGWPSWHPSQTAAATVQGALLQVIHPAAIRRSGSSKSWCVLSGRLTCSECSCSTIPVNIPKKSHAVFRHRTIFQSSTNNWYTAWSQATATVTRSHQLDWELVLGHHNSRKLLRGNETSSYSHSFNLTYTISTGSRWLPRTSVTNAN